jgi:hypothetical protein
MSLRCVFLSGLKLWALTTCFVKFTIKALTVVKGGGGTTMSTTGSGFFLTEHIFQWLSDQT